MKKAQGTWNSRRTQIDMRRFLGLGGDKRPPPSDEDRPKDEAITGSQVLRAIGAPPRLFPRIQAEVRAIIRPSYLTQDSVLGVLKKLTGTLGVLWCMRGSF